MCIHFKNIFSLQVPKYLTLINHSYTWTFPVYLQPHDFQGLPFRLGSLIAVNVITLLVYLTNELMHYSTYLDNYFCFFKVCMLSNKGLTAQHPQRPILRHWVWEKKKLYCEVNQQGGRRQGSSLSPDLESSQTFELWESGWYAEVLAAQISTAGLWNLVMHGQVWERGFRTGSSWANDPLETVQHWTL